MLRHPSLPYRMAFLSPVADYFEPNVKMNIRSLLLGATLMLGTQAVSSCHPVKPDWEQLPVHEFTCAESTVPSRRMTNDLKANTPRLPPCYCLLQHLRGQEQPRKLMAMAFEEYHSYLFSTINAFRAVSTQRYTRFTSKAHGTRYLHRQRGKGRRTCRSSCHLSVPCVFRTTRCPSCATTTRSWPRPTTPSTWWYVGRVCVNSF